MKITERERNVDDFMKSKKPLPCPPLHCPVNRMKDGHNPRNKKKSKEGQWNYEI